MTLIILRDVTNRTCFAFIVLLCLCIGMQMLGSPITMWNPLEEESDAYENLDFSIPPTIPRLNPSILHTLLESQQQNLYILLLLQTVFRPPKSPQ